MDIGAPQSGHCSSVCLGCALAFGIDALALGALAAFATAREAAFAAAVAVTCAGGGGAALGSGRIPGKGRPIRTLSRHTRRSAHCTQHPTHVPAKKMAIITIIVVFMFCWLWLALAHGTTALALLLSMGAASKHNVQTMG